MMTGISKKARPTAKFEFPPVKTYRRLVLAASLFVLLICFGSAHIPSAEAATASKPNITHRTAGRFMVAYTWNETQPFEQALPARRDNRRRWLPYGFLTATLKPTLNTRCQAG